jgi:hypothetical protein
VVLKDEDIFAYAMGDELHIKYEDVCLCWRRSFRRCPKGKEKGYAWR